MDYKIIVLLLVLLFLIVLVYREISTLKDQVDKTIMTTTIASKQLNDRHELVMQHNMDKYLSQIKNIGTENLQQLKKITMLNHQPIIQKKTSNHFTETDGSEVRSHGKYYMSEGGEKTEPIPIYDELSINSDETEEEEEENCEGHNILEQEALMSPVIDINAIQTKVYNSMGTFENLFNGGVYIIHTEGEKINPLSEEKVVESVTSESLNVVKPPMEETKVESIEEEVQEQKLDLKAIEEYTINELRTLSKQLMIPTTYRHQNKPKPYNKEDLYNNIKKKYI